MIVFCTSVKDRAATCVPLLQALGKLPATAFRLNLLDWHSTDYDYARAVRSLPYRVDLSQGPATEDYNRALGRTLAYAIRPSAPEDIVFFLDADMLVPPDFCATIASHVARGRCYFPICYSLYEGKSPCVHLDRRPQHPRWREANGWWRKAGYGNCGFVAADYVALGGWNGAGDRHVRRAHRSLVPRGDSHRRRRRAYMRRSVGNERR